MTLVLADATDALEGFVPVSHDVVDDPRDATDSFRAVPVVLVLGFAPAGVAGFLKLFTDGRFTG